MHDLAADLALLTEAARASGEIALRYWRRHPKTWDKDDGAGPVTEADFAVNDMLAETLRGARPDYGWLSEETPDNTERLGKSRTFIIDPIDGTRAFIAGEDCFSHSLAIAEDGHVIAGAIYLPALDRMYTAQSSGPALLNGAEIKVSNQADIPGATLLTTKPNMVAEHWPGGVPDLKRAFRPSLAYRFCLVAEGRYDGMATFRPAWEWDIAAGALIAARAGAIVTDGSGLQLRFNAPDPRAPGALVASPGLHNVLMARRR